MNTEQRIKQIIARVSTDFVDIKDIKKDLVLTDDLGYNSLQIVELIVELENEFNIEIDDDDLEVENLIFYNKLCKMLNEKIMN